MLGLLLVGKQGVDGAVVFGPLLVEARVEGFGQFQQVGLPALLVQVEQDFHPGHVAVPAHRVGRGRGNGG